MAKVLTASFAERYYFEPHVYVQGKYAADVSLKMVMDVINAVRKLHPDYTLYELTIEYKKRKDGLEIEYSMMDDNDRRAYLPYYHFSNSLITVKYQYDQTKYYLNSNGSQATEEHVSELKALDTEAYDAYYNSIKEARANSGTYKACIGIEWRKSKKGE